MLAVEALAPTNYSCWSPAVGGLLLDIKEKML